MKNFKTSLAPLIAIAVSMSGAGFLTTLIGSRLDGLGYDAWGAGILGLLYNLGLVIGCFRCSHFISQVGHIRAYSTFASLMAFFVLLQGIFPTPYIWVISRVVTGFCVAGIFIVVESWLLAEGSVTNRGKILALYNITLYLSYALGQFFLNYQGNDFSFSFVITAALIIISVLPISITKSKTPVIEEPEPTNLKTLLKFAPSGLMGSFCSGLILSAIYSQLPLFIKNEPSIGEEYLSIIMFATIIGGMLFQYPLGHYSDKIDRRYMLLALSIITSVLIFLLILLPIKIYIVIGMMFAIGAALFSIYPVSISHVSDYIKASNIVSVVQALVLVYGIGSVLGPMICALFMHLFKGIGILIYILSISIILSAFIFYRIRFLDRFEKTFPSAHIVMPANTPIAPELSIDIHEKEEEEVNKESL